MGELLPVGPEGVGVEDLGPRLHIGPVDVQQPLRVVQGGEFGGGPHRQALGLEHGAHAPVQEHGAAGLQEFKKFHSVHLTFDTGSRRGRDSPHSFGCLLQ